MFTAVLSNFTHFTAKYTQKTYITLIYVQKKYKFMENMLFMVLMVRIGVWFVCEPLFSTVVYTLVQTNVAHSDFCAVCDEYILTVERANIFLFFCRTGSEACQVCKDLEFVRGSGCPKNSKVPEDLACGFNPAERGPRKCPRLQRCPMLSKV